MIYTLLLLYIITHANVCILDYYLFMQKKYNVTKRNVTLHQNNYTIESITLINANDEAGKHSISA